MHPETIACSDNGTLKHSQLATTSNARLLASKGDARSTVFHGGANAVWHEAFDAYLASFHAIHAETGRYLNYLYLFEPDPPFAIQRISGLLPLLAAPVTDESIGNPLVFQSGLTVLPDGSVIVSYGSSNTESRMLHVPQTQLQRFFEKDD